MKIFLLFVSLFVSQLTLCQVSKWQMKDYETYLLQNKNKVLVINFWATFCKPCIAEIPGMIEAAKTFSNDSVSIVFVSVDEPAAFPFKLQSFIKKRNWVAPIAWLNETDADYFCPIVDPAWSGSIPATLIIQQNSGYRAFFEEEFMGEKLKKEIGKALNR